uniref:WRKY domain-containing protein n=1 Tax=Leersia perrieri TaxID=77586 RepID=A0A0D9V778_9ORYZ
MASPRLKREQSFDFEEASAQEAMGSAAVSAPYSPPGGVFGISPPESSPRDGRKRRKDRPSWVKHTFTPHFDGHLWRKYGQKNIKDSAFPRLYYRCSYREDRQCLASKLVQQENDDDPPLYKVTYTYEHTCNTTPVPTPDVVAEQPAPVAAGDTYLLRFGSSSNDGGVALQNERERHQHTAASRKPFMMLSFDSSSHHQLHEQKQNGFSPDQLPPVAASPSPSFTAEALPPPATTMAMNDGGDLFSTWDSFRYGLDDDHGHIGNHGRRRIHLGCVTSLSSKMAFGQDTIEQLYRELTGGRHLSAKLQALLEGPLDSRSQKEAEMVSRELGRVFMVSLYMLKPCSSSSSRPEEVTRTSPETTRTDDSICPHTPARVKRIRTEEVSVRNGRDEVVTRREITPSPYKDGYQWKKYGQKNIQDNDYLRLYYKCTFSRERRCAAKKQVQQQDAGEPPMFLVTYLNEHTCHLHHQTTTTTAAGSSPTTTAPPSRRNSSSPEALDSAANGSGVRLLLPHAAAAAAEEDAAIVKCLANVIRGGAGASDPPVSATTTTQMDYFFLYDPSTFSPPVVAAADEADRRVLLMGDCVDATRVARNMETDTAWPRYTRDTSAWR